MSDSNAPDSVLTGEQSRSLPLLLNMIIPPDKEKGMPGAGELDFVSYICEFEPNQIEAIQRELNILEQESQRQYKNTFADLDPIDRERLVDQLRKLNAQFAQTIVVQTMACYYQNDQVVIALGMEVRPPFPKGNEVIAGDLSLLDPVRERAQLYRDI